MNKNYLLGVKSMKNNFIFYSMTQAQPSKERENYQNNDISDDTEKLQAYQNGQSAVNHVLNFY